MLRGGGRLFGFLVEHLEIFDCTHNLALHQLVTRMRYLWALKVCDTCIHTHY